MITYPARPTNGGPPRLMRPLPGNWRAQPKYNGWRGLVHLPSDGTCFPSMWNRHGQLLTIAESFRPALHEAQLRFPLDTWLDCETLERRGTARGTLMIFDCVHPTDTWAQRRDWLHSQPVFVLPWRNVPSSDSIYLVEDFSPTEIPEAIEHFTAINAKLGEVVFEGFVRKRDDSLYPIQTRDPEKKFPYWIKHRFA